MDCKIISTKKSCRGMRLIEILRSAGIGVLAMTAICSFYFFSNRSFAAQYNYVDMDQYSHKALDQLSKQIRQVKALTAFSTNRLVFTDYDDATLSFTYDRSSRTLVRTKGGQRDVLLTGCDSLAFSIFQRNPVGGTYDQYP